MKKGLYQYLNKIQGLNGFKSMLLRKALKHPDPNAGLTPDPGINSPRVQSVMTGFSYPKALCLSPLVAMPSIRFTHWSVLISSS